MKKFLGLFLLFSTGSFCVVPVDRASIIQTDIVPFIQNEDQGDQVASLTDELATTEASLESVTDELATTESLIEPLEQEVASLTDELGTVDSLLDQAEDDIESLTDDLDDSNSLIDRAEELLHDDSIPDASSLDALASLYANEAQYAGVNPVSGLITQIDSGLNPYLQAALTKLKGNLGTPIISAGRYFTAVLTDEGDLFACGINTSGQLGIGSTSVSEVELVSVNEPSGGFNGTPVGIDLGNAHMVVLTSAGSVYACGSNSDGQLGINDTSVFKSTLESMIEPLGGFSGTPVAVSAGGYYTAVLTDDGSLYACGKNDYGQLGVGNMAIESAIRLISMVAPSGGFSGVPIAVSSGGTHTVVLTDNGSLYSCGRNNYGQLGVGDMAVTTTSLLLAMDSPSGGFNGKPVAISAGNEYTVVLTDSGSLYACGANYYGQLGTNDSVSHDSLFLMADFGFKGSPIAVSAGGVHTIMLTDENCLYACGYNGFGQLGIEGVSVEEKLTQMDDPLENFSCLPGAVAAGYSSTVITTDCSVLYACGRNSYGELGIGSYDSDPHSRLIAMNPNFKPVTSLKLTFS